MEVVINPIYADAKTLAGRTVSWTDKALLARSGYMLEVMTASKIVENGKIVMESLMTGFSEYTALLVLQVSWNLLSPGPTFKRVFPQSVPCIRKVGNEAKDWKSLPKTKIIDTGGAAALELTGSELQQAQGLSYICCSLLRLFAKDKNNYPKAFDHILKSYKKFYSIEICVKSVIPHPLAMDALDSVFKPDEFFRNTLANFLYSYNSISQVQGMVHMLFEMHIQNTGMHGLHSYPLFLASKVGTGAPSNVLRGACHTLAHKSALHCIRLLLNMEDNGVEGEHLRNTYKYARLYNPDMFAVIQSKNCKSLVITLGRLAELTGMAGQGDVMQIAAIANVPEETKSFYKEFASNIHYALVFNKNRKTETHSRLYF